MNKYINRYTSEHPNWEFIQRLEIDVLDFMVNYLIEFGESNNLTKHRYYKYFENNLMKYKIIDVDKLITDDIIMINFDNLYKLLSLSPKCVAKLNKEKNK